MSYIDSLKNDNVFFLFFGGERVDVFDNNPKASAPYTDMIPVYYLHEESNGDDFYGKPGDFVIGGGGGEHDALSVNVYDTLSHMNVIDDDEFEKLMELGVVDDPIFFENRMNWSVDTVYEMRKNIEKWGYDSINHGNIYLFFSVNLVSFLYHKFKFKDELEYLPNYTFELPEDEALQGKMFEHYHESSIKPGLCKEWHEGFNTRKSYFMSLKDLREEKIDNVILE